jgi:hypothetical protein
LQRLRTFRADWFTAVASPSTGFLVPHVIALRHRWLLTGEPAILAISYGTVDDVGLARAGAVRERPEISAHEARP